MLSTVSLFTLSVKLMDTKHLSVGHAILPQCVQYIPVGIFSAVPVWLDQGSTLGTIQPYSGDIHPCELEKHTSKPNSTSIMMVMTLEEQNLLLILEKQINHELSPDNQNILLAL
jgi:hypothetical protein